MVSFIFCWPLAVICRGLPGEERVFNMSAGSGKQASIFQFFGQVRQEIRKVTWPSSKEVVVTSVLVFFMVLAFALFFLAVDQVLGACIRFVLGWGR